MSACAHAPYNPLLGPACPGFRPTAYRGNLGPVKSGIDTSRRSTFRIYLQTAAMRARTQPQSLLLLLRALKHSPARHLNLGMMQSTQAKGPRS